MINVFFIIGTKTARLSLTLSFFINQRTKEYNGMLVPSLSQYTLQKEILHFSIQTKTPHLFFHLPERRAQNLSDELERMSPSRGHRETASSIRNCEMQFDFQRISPNLSSPC